MKYTEEEMEFLKTVEDRLYTACYCKFVRIGSRQQIERLDAIYKRVFGKDSGLIGGCSHCCLRICKEIGLVYFEQKKAAENAEKDAAEKESPKEEAIEKPKAAKKTTTKKKTTNKKK